MGEDPAPLSAVETAERLDLVADDDTQFGIRQLRRVCGADAIGRPKGSLLNVLPPRVRGGHRQLPLSHLQVRVTPAGAGRTSAFCGVPSAGWCYPRVCGADSPQPVAGYVVTVLPPRVRGGHGPYLARREGVVCYPRVCGADPPLPPRIGPLAVLPPRVRGGPS